MKVENRLALVGGLTALVTLVLFVKGVREVTEQTYPERPNLVKTPGVAEPLPTEAICAARAVPSIPDKLRKSVFDHYGIERPKAEDYEMDLLIPASLGGTADEKNLWPQPTGHIDWNARIKNALELQLHELVCTGKIPLQEAQTAIVKDWIAAYQTYFKARLPLTIHTKQ